MVFRGVIEQLQAANRAALLEDGWTLGRPPKLRPDLMVLGRGQLVMMDADEHHQPAGGRDAEQ